MTKCVCCGKMLFDESTAVVLPGTIFCSRECAEAMMEEVEISILGITREIVGIDNYDHITDVFENIYDNGDIVSTKYLGYIPYPIPKDADITYEDVKCYNAEYDMTIVRRLMYINNVEVSNQTICWYYGTDDLAYESSVDAHYAGRS